jgi:flagellar biosynthetic protein FlhB
MADKSDKTEKPTPKKKREARKSGNIAKSAELGTWMAVLISSYAIPSMFRSAAHNVRVLMFQIASVISNPDEGQALHMFGQGLQTAALTVLPLALTMMAVGVTTNLAQTGWAPTTKSFKPKISKLNPAKGFKRLVSPHTLWELGKSVLKLTVLGLVTWKTMRSVLPALTQPGTLAIGTVAKTVTAQSIKLARAIAGVGFVLAAVDYAMQRRRTSKSMKMSKQEIKEEGKASEGNPAAKGAQRKQMHKMSRLRMMSEVGKADAVIVNPTHYLVAVRYEAAKGAPRVVAKGVDELAQRLREEAEKNNVPVIEDIPLARTMWSACEVGDEIPADLYEAVARVLAFVFALRANGRPRPLAGAALHVSAPPL